MKLIIGLGNPGKQYAWTRHNLGWLALDAFAHTHGEDLAWQKHHQAKALTAKHIVNGQPVLLIMPQTFMNDSGDAVRDLLDFYKASPSDLLVVHDDIDLAFGSMRISTDSSAGGNNGVQSIINELGTQDFLRLRLGVKNADRDYIPADKFVLQPFGFFEKRAVKKWLPKVADAMLCLIENEPRVCMNRFH